MRQMVFANIFVEGWTIYPNVYSFFDLPDIEDEQDHIKQALSACKYPKWALNRVEKKTRVQRQSRNKTKDSEVTSILQKEEPI